MFIKQFSIKYFRNIKTLDLILEKGLNVFIGENNSGKSATMDALRICLGWGDQDKGIFIRPDDVYIDRSNHEFESKPIEFSLFFQIEKEIEQSIFYDLLSKTQEGLELQIHFKFSFEDKGDRKVFHYSVWGGDNEGQAIPNDILDLIKHIYLGALRDSSKDLQISRGNRLGCLLEKIQPDKEKQAELSQKLDNILHEDEDWKKIREEAKQEINKHLDSASIKGKEIRIDLRFIDSEFRKIVGELRARMPVYTSLTENDHNQRWFQINQNGLGDNNRIYIASVLSDLLGLKNSEEDTYVALLIEEPEAHLHPQLQNVLFSYFETLSSNIQVFITSHSPTITAKTFLDTITVFQNLANKIYTLPLKNVDLTEKDKSYLHRFLDVTKAQLFFANGVILVEGISEALLFPVFAQIVGFNEGNKNKYDLTKCGIEIVNVGGVSFSYFAKIFNSTDPRKRLSNKCVIVTDSDSKDNSQTMSDRAKNAAELKSGLLDVQLSTKTFEHDLFEHSEKNSGLMKSVYKEMHPLTEIISADDLLKKLNSNKDKGEFAQKLADKIDDSNFTIPEYIVSSIKWVAPES